MTTEEVAELAEKHGARVARAPEPFPNAVVMEPAQLAALIAEVRSNAWAEGYSQGVEDERTSEDNIGIAGFGAKVEPARENPYTIRAKFLTGEEA